MIWHGLLSWRWYHWQQRKKNIHGSNTFHSSWLPWTNRRYMLIGQFEAQSILNHYLIFTTNKNSLKNRFPASSMFNEKSNEKIIDALLTLCSTHECFHEMFKRIPKGLEQDTDWQHTCMRRPTLKIVIGRLTSTWPMSRWPKNCPDYTNAIGQ